MFSCSTQGHPLDDTHSTYTQFLASSKTYRHMYRLVWLAIIIEISPSGVGSDSDSRSILAETILHPDWHDTHKEKTLMHACSLE